MALARVRILPICMEFNDWGMDFEDLGTEFCDFRLVVGLDDLGVEYMIVVEFDVSGMEVLDFRSGLHGVDLDAEVNYWCVDFEDLGIEFL